MSYSLWPHGLWPTRLLCPWNSPGKNAGGGCHALLQGIFLTQGLNLDLLHCRQIFFTVWATRNWCFQTVVLERTLESPLDCKEIKPVNPKGNQPWIFIGRTGAEAPILWPPDVKNQLVGNDPDAGKDGGQEEKGVIEDEMVGWHHQLSEHKFEQTLGDSEGLGSLACCSPWGSQKVRYNWETEQQKKIGNIVTQL